QMMAVALVGAGEAMATRLSTDDIDVDEAAELMIDLFWHGLRGIPEDREPASALPDVGGPGTLSG
ncbi:TetR/AcrR family transcriptional regulator, partial [Mycobacterium sp. THU-M116]